FHTSSVVDHKARRLDFSGHLRELKLNPLEIGDAFAKLLALLGVPAGVLPSASGHAGHLGADADPAFIQGFNRNLVSLALLAQHIRARHTAFLQDKFAT